MPSRRLMNDAFEVRVGCRRLRGLAAALASAALCGCAVTPNQFREDGPSVELEWDSPSSADVKGRYALAQQRVREWPAQSATIEDGRVLHLPHWFEDPFVDKGAARTDETHPRNVYRMGWEDFVALPYGPARFYLNMAALPVSMVVSPPWQIQASDGVISRQALGPDHDAAPLDDDAEPQSAEAVEARDAAPAMEPGSEPR